MPNIKTLVDMVKAGIGDQSVDLEELSERCRKVGAALGLTSNESAEAYETIQKEMDISMDEGAVLVAQGHEPWVEGARAQIDWRYYDRYRQYLLKSGFPVSIVNQIGRISERILDSAGDPRRSGSWSRKGMVIGDVQSGKTANYTALLARAVDVGYKVIIVIAGIHNNLRSQTQSRLDEGLTGFDSANALQRRTTKIGVGISSPIDPSMTSFTNTNSDFKSSIAQQLGVKLNSLAGPVVFVIKKNHSTLRNLVDWLKAYNAKGDGTISSVPMILIDDEADNASINTSADPEQATKINRLIRELLGLFDQSVYIGYTATPFANIFIDDGADISELGEDLFPRDFIHSLDAPSNYMGAEKYFSSDRAHLRFIDDMESVLPLKHKNHCDLPSIPASLRRAVRLFILVRAIRILRGQQHSHNSMLVNVSRFTSVQNNVSKRVLDLLEEYRQDIMLYSKLPEDDALRQSPTIASLRQDWSSEYATCGFNWGDILPVLGAAVSPISVVTVNSRSSEGLNYQDYNQDGRHIIAIGGFSLSRGLTLEGLSISYFYRNSIMYDTLLQMARWFGYRPGYEDLCRVFMSEDGADWYRHISEAAEELRKEVKRMEVNKLTPQEFGLRVRRHPDTLIVTAQNKMRRAEKYTQAVTLSNSLIETHLLDIRPASLDENQASVRRFLSQFVDDQADSEGFYSPEGYFLATDVLYSAVREFLNKFIYNENCMRVQKTPLLTYLDGGRNFELATWDVAVTAGHGTTTFNLKNGCDIRCRERTIGIKRGFEHDQFASVGNNFRVGQATDEALGLPIKKYNEIVEALKERTNRSGKSVSPSGSDYRQNRTKPLIAIHLLDLKHPDDSEISYSAVPAFSISFPEARNRSVVAQEYMVNSVWWRQFIQPERDEDEEVEEEP